MTRDIEASYRDPLDLIWLHAAAALGLRVVRSDEVYASWDGRGTLTLCTPATYDADDSLAQLLFHELCHALVQGPAYQRRPDWGLHNEVPEASALEEHACHRLQAALAARWGLRALLAVTTDWRPYWDALPADPLAEGDDPAIPLARHAWSAATRGPWSGPLRRALEATARLAAVVRDAAPSDSLWARTVPLHPKVAVALGPPDARCGGCAWRTAAGDCLAADAPTPTDATDPACLRWEAPPGEAACAACGACCREGFHVVGVEPDEPLATARPDLVVDDGGLTVVPRPGGRCAALVHPSGPPWRCAVYALRPMACQDFEPGGAHCLTARRRVGLSPPG